MLNEIIDSELLEREGTDAVVQAVYDALFETEADLSINDTFRCLLASTCDVQFDGDITLQTKIDALQNELCRLQRQQTADTKPLTP